MYRITCDGLLLLDTRLEDYIVLEPKVNVETNTVGECSFTIYNNHPHYNDLHPLKSAFEVSDENGVIFRGRMTNDTRDFYNGKAVDLEGAMAFFNDSMVRPFVFPDDFGTISSNVNVVWYFLNWLINQHNEQVELFQQFKLGRVTVTDPNNYIARSSENIASTWDTLKEKLFDSSLGGYLCIRYEEDGNYIDYLADFEDVNTQEIRLGQNLLDMKCEVDASATYSAIIPIGADIEVEEDGETITKKLTLESIADGKLNNSDDTYKVTLDNGLHAIYSKSAVEEYGWICCPVEEATWDDVTDANNLKNKAREYLLGTASLLGDNIEVTAADLHFADAEVRSFRIYKKVNVISKPHNIDTFYNLSKLEIDLLNPQNTKIVVGTPKKTLTAAVSDGAKESKYSASANSSSGGGGGIAEETDPTVPAWAKEPKKPSYTAAEVGALPDTTKIPSKTSDLANDSGFITGIPSTYVTEEELEAKHYLTSVPDNYVTKHDLDTRGYLTESDLDVELDQFMTEAEVEAAIDSKGFLTDSDLDTKFDTYVTEAELEAKGYVTEADLNLDNYPTQADFDSLSEDIQNVSTSLSTEISQLAEDMPTKVSDLENDSGFLTAVPSEYVTETELEAKKYLTSVPSEYVTETELTAKGYAKQDDLTDLSEWSHQAVDEIVDAVIEHRDNNVIHITAEERTSWNGKANQTDLDELSDWTHQAVDELVDAIIEPNKSESAFDLIGSDTLTWNGDADGKIVVYDNGEPLYAHVSNKVPTTADLQNGGSCKYVDTDEVYPFDSINTETDDYIIVDQYNSIVIAKKDMVELEGLTFPEKGIYLYYSNSQDYASHFTINGYTGFVEPILKMENMTPHGHDWYGKAINKGNTVRSDDIVHGGLVKVSDAVPTLAEVQKGGILREYDVVNGEISGELRLVNYLESPYGVYSFNGQIIIAGDGLPMVQIKDDGVYFRQDENFCIHSLTINGYTGFSFNLEKIPEELLPENNLSIDYLKHLMEETFVSMSNTCDGLIDENGNYLYDDSGNIITSEVTATTTEAGLMSPEDKAKLDSLISSEGVSF